MNSKVRDLFQRKICNNKMPSYEYIPLEYAKDGQTKVPKLYRREDFTRFAKEAFERGEDYFYTEPVDPKVPNGAHKLCGPKYVYELKKSLSEKEFEEYFGYNAELSVETVEGVLSAHISSDPNFPGIYTESTPKDTDFYKRRWRIYNMTNEMKTVHLLLSECFPKGKMLTHMDPIEFVAHPKGNVFFILGNCETKLEVDCKVLEYFSRAAYKTEPYYTESNNKKFHEYFLDGINRYFGSNFTEADIKVVYTYLGNCCNRQKTIEFIESGFDMSVLDPSLDKVCFEDDYDI